MVTRIRIVGLCLIAAFALSAATASTASASRLWLVNGLKLAEGATRELKIIKNSSFILRVSAASELISCETVKFGASPKPLIRNIREGSLGLDEGQIEFSKCKNVLKTGCTVGEPIVTRGTMSELVENTEKTKIYDLFLPEKPENKKLKPIATISQTGVNCVPSTTVEGTGVAAEMLTAEVSAKVKTFRFPGLDEGCKPKASPITKVLRWNGEEEVLELKAFGFLGAEQCGEVEVELTTGEEWSAK